MSTSTIRRRGGGCPIILAKCVVSERELGLPAQRKNLRKNVGFQPVSALGECVFKAKNMRDDYVGKPV